MRIREKLIDLPDCIIFLNAETFPLHLDLSNQTEDPPVNFLIKINYIYLY